MSGRPLLRIAVTEFNKLRGWAQPSRMALGLCLVAAVLVGGGSAMVAGPLATPAPSPTAVAAASSSACPSVVVAPTASPTATPTPAPPSSAAVAMAIASRSSWILYKSTTYKFTVAYPTDWAVSETQVPGWAIISSRDSTPLQITWRAVSSGTTLDTVSAELWKTMHDLGYTIVDTKPATVSGRQARVLTVDGPTSAAKPRHGLIALVVTSSGRYRIELWTIPGGDASAATLFNDFLGTFTIQ